MNYLVIYKDGTEQYFYIRGMAEMNARLYDGRVVGKPKLTLITDEPSQPMLTAWVAA